MKHVSSTNRPYEPTWIQLLGGFLVVGFLFLTVPALRGPQTPLQAQTVADTQNGSSLDSVDPPASQVEGRESRPQASPGNSPSGPLVPSSVDSEELVRRSVWQAVWGPSVQAKVRQKNYYFDKQLLYLGMYVHAGEGSGKVNWRVRLAAAGTMTNYLQISDGRLLWVSRQTNEQTKLSRIDLGRIREQIGPLRQSDLSNPVLAMDLAIGGQAELLRHLYQRYQWVDTQQGELDKVPVWVVRGRIREKPPIPSGRAPVDKKMEGASTLGLLPDYVRLTVGRGENLTYFPYRIEYLRKSTEPSGGGIPSVVSVIEFFEVKSPANLDPRFFQYDVNDSVEQIQDETASYLPPSALNVSQISNGYSAAVPSPPSSEAVPAPLTR